jgi:hypothetical protein
MRAARMGVGKIGIGAFDPQREVVRHEHIKDAVDRIGRDPLAARYGGEPWRPWPPALAAERFLAELTQLQAKAG